MKKINWDVVKQAGGQVLVVLGAVGNVLVLMGYASPDQVDHWVAIGGSILSTLVMIGPMIIVVLQQTDTGKANQINRLDTDGKIAVLDKMSTATKLAAAVSIPEVKKIVVADHATGSVAKAANDGTIAKVVTESAAKAA